MLDIVFIVGMLVFAASSAYFWIAGRGKQGLNLAFMVSFVTLVSCVLMWQGKLTVYAQGRQFVAFAGPPGFTGTRTGDSVTFQLTDDIMNAPTCFVDGNLPYSGVATGTITERGIVATFDGKIGTCQAADHRMELVRMQTPLH